MPAFLLFLVLTASTYAAETFVNGQLHRDFHREIFTSTVEVWSGDRLGSSFLFADFDFARSGQTQSYFEVSRHFAVAKFKTLQLNATLQYNDGVTGLDAADSKVIPRTFLGGIAITEIRFGSAILEVQALLRQEFASFLGWQLTGVWFWPVAGTPLEFLGSVDWNTNKYGGNPESVQAEPQLQVRWRQVAVGSEWELSRNFAGAYTEDGGFDFNRWYFHPTVFVRYDL